MRTVAEVTLDREPDAVPRARRLVRAALSGEPPDLVADAELVVSELTTNATLHGEPPITVRVLRNRVVRVEIEDAGRHVPILLRQGPDAMTGRGLAMVSRVVSSWGVEPLDTGGKVVWAEIDAERTGPAPVSASPQIDVDALLDAWADDDPGATSYTVHLGPVSTQLLLDAKSHIDNVVRELMLMREGEASSGVALPLELSALVQTVTVDFAEARTEIKRQAAAAAADGRVLTDLELHLSPSAADAGERYLEALDQADRYARSAHFFLTLAPPQVHRIFRRWYVGVIVEQLRALARGEAPPEPVPFQVVLANEVAVLSDVSGTSARLDLMHKVSRALARAVTVEEMAQIAVDHALEFPGVESARVRLLDPDGLLRSIAWRGRPGREDRRPAPVPVNSDLPPGVATRSQRPMLLRGSSRGQEHSEWAGYQESGLNGHVFPLVVGGHSLGLLTLAIASGELSDQAELEFAASLADLLGHAIRRAQIDREVALAEEATRLLERLPGAVLGVDDTGTVTVCNLAAARLLQVESGDLIGRPLVSIMPQRLRDAHRAAFSQFVATGEGGLLDTAPFVVPALLPDGREVALEMALTAAGHPVGTGTVALATIRLAEPGPEPGPHPLIGRFTDASIAALAGQKEVLERMVAGEPVESVLASLVRVIETAGEEGSLGSILLLDPDGRHLTTGAAPSLPDSYNQAVDGIEIGPNAGSCGTAAYRRAQVVVEDIASDPLWADYKDLALGAGLRACWSTPIVAGDGELLGTFAVYYTRPRGPSDADRNLLGLLVHTAAIALVRARADRARDEALAQEQAAREELELAHRNLTFVLDATTQVASSLDSDDTLRTLARIAVPALADICLIDLVEGASLRRVATAAGDEVEREVAARLGRFSPDVDGVHPAAVAVRTRAPVFAQSAPPEFEAIPVDSCVGIPLTARGRTLGAMTLVMIRPGRRYDQADVAVVEDLASRVALAISNVQLYEDSREAQRRLALVARAGVSLTSSLDLDTVVARLCEVITGDVADRCEVHVRRAPGQWWRYTHRSGLDRLVRVDRLPEAVEEAVAAGRTLTLVSAGEEVFSGGTDQVADSISSVIPLVAHDEVVGVIALVSYGGHGPTRVPADTAAIIAGRAALAIDNALLYEQERTAAEILQRSLLPHHLPATRGLRSAARYLPAGARNEVGGDWYDLIEVGPGRVGVVMGDVMGRGIPAASIMGQLRNGLRILAMQRIDPGAALGLLNRMLEPGEDSPLATVAYGVLDVESRTLMMANAGHMPPLLLHRSSCGYLDQKAGLPLGAFPDAVYTTAEHRLEAGDALVMYTDGLIEERDRSLEDGLAELLEVAGRAPRTDPDAICDRLLDLFRRENDEDDTAVLALLLDD